MHNGATKVKVCGLTRPADIAAVNSCKPAYIGFVFARESKRYIAPPQAAILRQQLAAEIAAVGVFVNETPEAVAALLNAGVIDIAQLHGSEDETYIRQLRQQTDKAIIKAFSVRDAQDIAAAEISSADYVLLDSGQGGTGTAFDWTLLHTMRRPYILAGGLQVNNVAAAVRQLHPYAVDVSSGVETDGVKDGEKIKQFVQMVRRENRLSRKDEE